SDLPVPNGSELTSAAHKRCSSASSCPLSLASSARKPALRRRNASGLTGIFRDGHSQGSRQSLIAGLGDVMVVLAVQISHVQGDAGVLCEGLKPLPEQLRIHVPDFRPGKAHLPHKV